MSEDGVRSSREVFEQSLEDAKTIRYVLALYITGATPKSTRAIASVRAICEQYLSGRYDLQVIDIYQQPDIARQDSIIAVPTLIKHLPLPLRRLVGDMTDEARVLAGLGLSAQLQ